MAQAAVIDKCDICKTEDDVKYYCINCREVLCSKCHFVHINGKRTKNDDILLLQEAKKKYLKKTPMIHCNEHETDVTLWCNKCEDLICTECLTGKHNAHKISKLKDIVESKTKELMDVKKILTDRKVAFQEAFDTEDKTHSEYIKSMEKLKTVITDQKSKIIEVLNIVCHKHFSEVSLLLKREQERYTDACINIQKQSQVISSVLQSIENAVASKRPTTIIQAIKDGNQLIRQGPAQPNPSKVTTTRFLPDIVNQEAVLRILGGLHTEHKGAIPKQRNIAAAFKEQQIDLSNIKVKSTFQVKGKTESVKVIVPMDDDTLWVVAFHDKYLTLITNNGDTIRKSISLPSDVNDAKKYNKDLLVTYHEQQISKLSANGSKKTVFADLNPYYPTGLCVTDELDVLVCVRLRHKNDSFGRVCRLVAIGKIMQVIQNDQTGDSLYDLLISVTSLPTGEIITTDGGENGKVVCVNKHGRRLFTWSGEMDDGKINKLGAMHITHDQYNNLLITDYTNHKLYTLGKDGTKAKCLLDKTQGIQNPMDLVFNHTTGNLLVGCKPGTILVIQN